ncbi:MAG: glycosyltransferase family 9 protein [Armatimonadetes bacterium]|nr:glycosyltransferase family 9 protein [Anaerolineae bacterium]
MAKPALYALLGRLLPSRHAPPVSPRRIVLIQPCCIGDVVLATATLQALRRRYPAAHITWAVGQWSRAAVAGHDLLDDLLDTGKSALPVGSVGALWQFVRQLRAGRYDLAVSLVRSPRMSLAVWLSGIPQRAGIDSDGRGFGYNLRAAIDPRQARHEAEIYLDVARLLGADTTDCYANIPVTAADTERVQSLVATHGISSPFMLINPAGGSNPGMLMDAKRYPPAQLAQLAEQLSVALSHTIVMVAGPQDGALVDAVSAQLATPPVCFVGTLSFAEIAALARLSQLYIGNDTGLTHLAAAAGAKTVMLMGPSDPRRYAPFARDAIAIWKPSVLHAEGVTAGTPPGWDWAHDGIGVDEAYARIMAFV